MFKLLKEVFRTGTATVRYPFVPVTVSPNFRGKPHYDPERCIACGACAVACPANALSMTTHNAAGKRTWEICFGRCVFCGRCEEVCPTQAIALSPEYELAVMDRADLYQTAEFRLASCRVCGTPFAPRKEIDYVLTVLVQSGLAEEQLEERRARLGTCPACKRAAEARLAALAVWPQEGLPVREIDLGTPPSKAEHQVTLTIDGISVSVPEGTSIMRAAMQAGIAIPRLCATDSEIPHGSCRLCLVEIEGRAGTPASCTTPVSEGLVVRTQTEHLRRIRRGIMELYISDHPLDCRNCSANGFCELEDMALAVGVHDTPYGLDGANHLEAGNDQSNPYFTYNPAKCIVCLRCVRACNEIQGTFALSVTGRGFASRVAAGMEQSFLASECVSCGACVQTCPTASLLEKPVIAAGQPRRSVITTCVDCSIGCSFKAETRGEQLVRMEPHKNGKPNRGHSCVKGRFAWGTDKDRILTPMIREKISEPWRQVSWEEAIGRAASEFRRIWDIYGQNAIAGVASSRCTNEEAYLAQKLVHGGFEDGKTDAAARMGRLSTGYGAETTPAVTPQDFDSVEQAELIVVIGANLTNSHPVFASRIKRRLREGARLIVVDPARIDLVRTPHVEAAQHLALRQGTDLTVLNAMAHVVVTEGLVNRALVDEDSEKFVAWAAFVSEKRNSPEETEKLSGVPAKTLRAAARLYATCGKAAVIYGVGVIEQSQGGATVDAITNLAMATSNMGRPGTGVYPLRGQNNLQGSSDIISFRHEFPDYRRVSDDVTRAASDSAWRAALEVWPELRISNLLHPAEDGSFKGLYVVGEDIVGSDPDARHVTARLAGMECVVVQDLFLSETAKFAHVFLPGSTFLEKDGSFTNVELRISRVRKVLPPKNGYPDWEITLKLGQAMGYPVHYSHPSDIMDEIGRTNPSFAGASYDRLEAMGSVQWPCNDRVPAGAQIVRAKDGQREFVITD